MGRSVAVALLSAALACAACSTAGTGAPAPVDSTANASQAAPSGRALLLEASRHAQAEALDHQRVDWEGIVAELQVGIPADAPPSAAHDAIRVMLARYGDPHARLVELHAAPPHAVPAADPAPPAHPPIPTLPEGRLLADRVAYLVLPGCPGATPEERAGYANALRAVLRQLDAAQPLGWVIDLRLNGGGNMWPMLAGLWPLLGDGVHATSMGAQGTLLSMGCDSSSAWLLINGIRTRQQAVELVPGCRLVTPARRAVLIGAWTMSSGELIAGALRDCSATRLFGEPTAGLTTVTNNYPLSDGSVLILPVDRMCDRHGKPLGDAVRPDEPVPAAAWPTAEDATAAAASAWIKSAGAPAAAREAHRE